MPDQLRIVGLAARSNGDLLAKQADEFGVKALALYSKADADAMKVPGGLSAIVDLACLPEADVVVISVAGVIGLEPTVAAIRGGKQIALASKEVLVSAGEYIMPLAQKHNTLITPIDSEHSALFQCLQGYQKEQIHELILTASGGPFRGWTPEQLSRVSVDDALNHPTWRMGGKITVDSATLMNKGLEAVEAKWLFGVSIDQVKMVIHPQSIIHSMVKFTDGSVLGQMGWPDMRLPIQYALLYPERVSGGLPPWNPIDSPSLTFEPMDRKTFRCPNLALQSVKAGGTMPSVMNAANEFAANEFLEGRAAFTDIPEIVERTMARHNPKSISIDTILESDRWARETAASILSLL